MLLQGREERWVDEEFLLLRHLTANAPQQLVSRQ
jgi:hypothetical protein